MKIIARNVNNERMNRIEEQIEAYISYHAITTSGNTKTFTTHYWVDDGRPNGMIKVCSTTYHFDTGLTNVRMMI